MTSCPEDIAIIGAACRLPGGIASLDELWTALIEGRDLVGEIPDGRFDPDRFLDPDPLRPGKSYTFAGGFLPDVSGFDAGYFGISPREAAAMDPQQRILLELAVEAFDDAGLDRRRLTGSDTAVFIGLSNAAYGFSQFMRLNSVDVHTMSGMASSIAANRLSYVFDLRGPSMAVDTACSSALIALHQACEAVRGGRSALAVAGGFNLLIDPMTFVGFSKAMMLSPTFRCRSFSAGADGYVRAEGGGLVVVKRLADALADGDRVHAVLRATGANTDGRTAGLAMPNFQAQAALLREIYNEAGVRADDLVYLEAHGTGTPVGDPAECTAIGEALGRRRTAPLPIGSVKTNLGHLETASGMAGLFKAMLVLRHGTVPPSLHVNPPNPEIDFGGLGLEVVAETRSVGDGVVGVNSFGFGGANAHAILTPPPAVTEAPRRPERALPVLVSARSAEALAAAVGAMRQRLGRAGAAEFYDLAHTTCLRRTPDTHRAVVLATGPAEAADGLATAVSGEATTRDGVAFAFSGNGSQWAGMAQDLLAEEPVFRDAVEKADAALRPHLGWSVLDELTSAADRLADTAIAQPLLFTVQIGLVALLREHGVVPGAVVGHSVGEVAAACVAGALDLDTAARVVAERSTAQARTAGTGRMAAIGLARDRAAEVLVEFDGRLELAAVNSGQDVTVAGDAEAVEWVVEALTADGVAVRELDVDYAFHSRTMDPIEDHVRTHLANVWSVAPEIPMISTVTGAPLAAGELDGDYWWRNVRHPVLFDQAVNALADRGIGVLVEIGPHPVLTGYLRRTSGLPVRAVATLTRDGAGEALGERTAARVLASGGALDWARYFPGPGRVCDLPAYPWQRERHWKTTPESWLRTSGTGRVEHPLLGERMPVLEPTWHACVEPARTPWLADHRVAGGVVVPATGYVEMALAAGRRTLGGPVELTRLDITRALVLPWSPTMDVRIQVSLSDEDGLLRVASRHGEDGDWALSARGQVRSLVADAPAALLEPDTPALPVPGERHYADCERFGLEYGPAFRSLREIRVRPGETWANYEFELAQDGYEAHPALLDAALQAGMPLLGLNGPGSHAYLPSSIERVRLWRRPSAKGHIRVAVRSHTSREVCWDISVVDADGQVAVELTGCRLRSFGTALDPELHRFHTVLRAAPRPHEPAGPWPLNEVEPVAVRQTWWHDGGRAFARDSAAAFTVRAVCSLLPGRASFTTEDLVAAGVLPSYRRLLELLLRLARDRGWLREQADGWRVVEVPDPGALGDTARLRAGTTIVALYNRCGRNLPDVLCGRMDPLEVVLGDPETIANFYDLSPVVAGYNEAVRDLVAAIVRDWPADRPLRILEVGAGTGGTTAFVLPVLPPERTRYVFSDVSSAFLTATRNRFAAHDFVEYRTFDLNTDPAEQGYADGEFDLVIAANSLHTATDLAAALRRVNRLLAPSGKLIALETHDTEMIAMSMGLLESFWAFTDAPLRENSPLVPATMWPDLLCANGFTRVATTDDGTRSGLSVVVATAGDHDIREVRPTTMARWVVLVDDPADRNRADAVASALRAAGAEVATITSDSDGWAASVADAGGVAFVLGGAGADPVAETTRRASVLRAITTAVVRQEGVEPLPLWLVTRPCGALPLPERPATPADAAAWGVARTVSNENRALAVRRLSWDHGTDPDASAGRVVTELLDADDEDEIVLTAAGRFVPRVLPAHRAREAAGSFRLAVREPSLFYQLSWAETPRPRCGAGQVVAEVRAAALNYRDVMVVTGLLPPVAEGYGTVESARLLGMEFAGVVTEVGPTVTGLRPGDRIFGVATASFASHVAAEADAVSVIPDGMSFTEAATIPAAWLTVHHGLRKLARLRAGETVLVHGAAGGVGLAAIHLAHRVGATVVATAGSPIKRDFLRATGAEHVLDSRSLRFADEVMALTGGRGVDVVLNSLSGEALARGLEVLAPLGRFVEIGKRDIYGNSRLAMRPLSDNISLFAVDIANLPLQDRDLARQRTNEMFAAVRAGDYVPLAHRVYPAARIDEAFKTMQHSRHIGKIVVSFDDPVPAEPARGRLSLDPDATYLVIGGLGGFGAATARRLADRGARGLTLVARRGMDSPEARHLVEDLTASGVRVDVHAADVTDRAAMADVLARMDRPLRGVVHAAMVLEDRPLAELGDMAFRAALDPKLRGALILDELTRERELDFFVLYSSASTLLGGVKQANYVAGNLALEALARARRLRGLPALAVQWGAIAEAGYVAREGLQEHLALFGLQSCDPGAALDVLEDLLCGRHADVVAAGIFDWGTAGSFLPLVTSPRLAGLLPSETGEDRFDLRDFVRRVAALPRAEALRLLEDLVVTELARVMQTSPDRIDRDKSLDELGVDSLMGMELLVVLRQRFQFQASPIELLQAAKRISGLAELALGHLLAMAES